MNGQEKDDEVYGAGNLTSAEYWEYDSRTGRRWNIDPVPNAWESAYACFHNNPILFVDINGDNAGEPVTNATLESSKNQDKISSTTTSSSNKVSNVSAGSNEYNILANQASVNTPQNIQVNGIKLKETITTTIKTETIINYDNKGNFLNTSSKSITTITKSIEAFVDFSYNEGGYASQSSQPFQSSLGSSSSSTSQNFNGSFTNEIKDFAGILVNYRSQTGSSFTNASGYENQLKSQNDLVKAFQDYGYVSKTLTVGSFINGRLIKPFMTPKPMFGPALVVTGWVMVLGQAAERGRQILQGRHDANSCNNCKESYFIQGTNVRNK
jgi:hypothetical protein